MAEDIRRIIIEVLNFVAGWITGLITGLIVARASHVWRERAQDRRESERNSMELHGSARRILSEIERNGEARIELMEKIADPRPLERDAHETLRADAWREESVRLSQLMPFEDFGHLETYYRKREKLASDLRDYHRPGAYSKQERPAMRENLRRQADELGNFQQKAINATSKYLQHPA